jgi:glycosyltransferase involved in cell wall biosynthesis
VLSEGLDPARFEQRLLTGLPEPDEGDYVALRAPDLAVGRVVGLGRAPKAGADAHALAEIVGVIREFRPHIVHTHKAKAGVLGRLAAWGTRTPAIVHHYHGHLLHGYFSPRKTQAVMAVERLLALRTDRLVAVGAQVRDDLLAAHVGRRDQWRVVAPGVATAPTPERSGARAALGLPESGPVVGFVGRLTRVKQPERFVEIALALASEFPDASFVVAGDGELHGRMLELARPLGTRFVLLGWRSDVQTVYAACDVVALTSDNEGMPVSLIEAAAASVPVVSTRVGSAGEVVDDGVTGILTTTDVDALGAATARLLRDPSLRTSMGHAAGRRFQERFAASRLVDDVAAIYEELATGARLLDRRE